jgi:hypothetical protein
LTTSFALKIGTDAKDPRVAPIAGLVTLLPSQLLELLLLDEVAAGGRQR